MRRILLTGGAGFIGANALAYFLQKYPHYHIINFDKLTYAGSKQNFTAFTQHPQHTFIEGDITNTALVEKIFYDHAITDVIHFAAETHVDNSIRQPDVFVRTNVLGTFTLLETARKFWKNSQHRFHHISTDEVYGSLNKEGFFTESSPYAPNSPYSASKASSDHLVRSFFKTYGLNTVITNCSNNYGPYQHAEKLIPTIIRKALAGEKIPIYGNGENIRDWLYVEDHCRAIDQVFHHAPEGEQFNIGGNNEISNIQIAKMICEKLTELVPSTHRYERLIEFVTDRPGHDFRYAVSIEKINKLLGWEPQMDFAQGLSQTLAFYLKT